MGEHSFARARAALSNDLTPRLSKSFCTVILDTVFSCLLHDLPLDSNGFFKLSLPDLRASAVFLRSGGLCTRFRATREDQGFIGSVFWARDGCRLHAHRLGAPVACASSTALVGARYRGRIWHRCLSAGEMAGSAKSTLATSWQRSFYDCQPYCTRTTFLHHHTSSRATDARCGQGSPPAATSRADSYWIRRDPSGSGSDMKHQF